MWKLLAFDLETEARFEMPDDIVQSGMLPRQFSPSGWDRYVWRRLSQRRSGQRTLILLDRIEAERRQLLEAAKCAPASMTWLLTYRADLHWAVQHSYLEPIKLYLADCPEEMIPLGIWLWGKCADRFRLYGLSAFCHDPSPQVRRHVAKALRRLEAWSLLREMAAANPHDSRIQWYASAPTMHRPFAERLKDFTSNIDDSHADEVATPSAMPFWSSERAWERTPPKSVVLIRRMLRRIRHWVRWGMS
jgi:hypothetical protein